MSNLPIQESEGGSSSFRAIESIHLHPEPFPSLLEDDGATLVPRSVRFGEFQLDLQRLELTKDQAPIELQRRHAEVLAILVGSAGEIVTRERLIQEIWGKTIVDYDKSLNPIINRLRSALSDSARHPRYLETIHRQGYRFVETVEVVDELRSRGTREQPSARSDSTLLLLLLLLLAICSILVCITAWWPAGSAIPANQSLVAQLAIKPLETVGDQSSDEGNLGEVLTLQLAAELAQLGGHDLRLLLVGSEASETGSAKSQLLDEQRVFDLRGSVRLEENRYELTLALVQVVTGRVVWADRWSGSPALRTVDWPGRLRPMLEAIGVGPPAIGRVRTLGPGSTAVDGSGPRVDPRSVKLDPRPR